MKCYNGEKKTFSLRRMRCVRCRRLHIELPDILVPNKHYAAELIENVVDGVSTPDNLSTENYPCERTMQRRKDWILKNRQQIDGYLKSICTRVSASGSESSSIMKPVSWIKADVSAFKATVRRNPAITVDRIYGRLGTAEQVSQGQSVSAATFKMACDPTTILPIFEMPINRRLTKDHPPLVQNNHMIANGNSPT